MAKAPRDCPCFAGRRYTACCAPLHHGETLAGSPEALMRSRFAAFAMGLGDYLLRTLASDHEDRRIEEAVLVRELSRAHERQRFLGLRILHAEESAVAGQVMFFARVFEKGSDRSFVELSQFRREEGSWRYASGIVVPGADLPKPLDDLRPIDIFGITHG